MPPPKLPPDEPPGDNPPPIGKRGNPRNLAKGLTPNQERGPDGRIRRKPEGGAREETAQVSPPATPGLSDRVDDELAAIEHVYTHGPDADETWQQKNLRAVKDTSPIQFLNLRLKLQEERKPAPETSTAAGAAVDVWDGQGPCPTCGYEKEKPIRDEGTAKILAMLDELDRGKGAA